MPQKAKPLKAAKTTARKPGARSPLWLAALTPKATRRVRETDTTQDRDERLIRAAGRTRTARMSVFVEQARQARQGDDLAARAVIAHFASAVHRGEPINADVLRFLADAFEHFLFGKGKDTLESALGLRQRRGNRALGSGMAELIRACYDGQKEEKPKGALQRTAELLHLSKKQVERAVYADAGGLDWDNIL